MRVARILGLAVVALMACGRSGLQVGGAAASDAGGPRVDASPGDAGSTPRADAAPPPTGSPRLLAPLSTSTVTSRRPTLRWVLPPGASDARVELCADRACAVSIETMAGTDRARPATELTEGWVFWRVRSGAWTSATWQFRVGPRSAPIDTSWGAVLDVNGDGFEDEVRRLVMGAESWAAVHHGTADGFEPEPAIVLPPGPCNSGAGASSVGDVDGDGFGDLALAEASDWCRPGNVRLFLGGPDGVGATPHRVLEGPDEGRPGFGARVVATGDFDGDGYGDLAVGTGRRDAAQPLTVELWPGSPEGIRTERGAQVMVEPLSIRTEALPIAAGDLDGDGLGDLAIGPSIFLGNPLAVLEPAFTFDRFVKAAVVADVNGDGRADWVIGSDVIDPSIEPARLSAFHGTADGIGGAPASVFMGDDQYYARALSTDDFDEDGFADVEVLVPPGELRRYHGGPGGLSEPD